MQRVTKEAFLEVYPAVQSVISNFFIKRLPGSPDRATEWTTKVLNYNVPHGKLKRGLMVANSFAALKEDAPRSQLNAAIRVGWGVELLQSCFLVVDDIMDSSLTRRGQPCWYKQPKVGMSAVNDALLLENAVDVVIRDAVNDSQTANSVFAAFSVIKLNTVLGQHLDSEGGPSEACTSNHYADIVRLKTSNYSFYLPVYLGLLLAQNGNAGDTSELQTLCNDMGYYFQVQDDYLDCYGDSRMTGKLGTDIQVGKCTWLFINALSLAESDRAMLNELKENYGKPELTAINNVKRIYEKLGLEQLYSKFEKKQLSKLRHQIDEFSIIPLRPLFRDLLSELHNRRK